ncbi:hypothetical protein JKA74_12380 [Marivirga sp. S37H4]|uniref:Carboxypeptidase-like regulatory domain-containing protein n=1 Tax=Marivirga aurantiaca TaxID=2802615 RepID=A0A934WZN5_9BACT|nr:hypothetical protein [Marivirga aurantiaca]MBK6265832.1 hypothetical protein [Marivirga aurantiaca]
MVKKLLFLVLSMLMVSITNAQSIKGTLYSSQDSLAIEGAHIINTTRTTMATSSAVGIFTLEALPGDTMVISNINYNTKQFIVPKKKEVTIWLNPAEIQLKEVVVNNIPESQADFRKKLVDMPMQDDGNFLPLGVTPGKPMGKIPKAHERASDIKYGYKAIGPVIGPSVVVPMSFFTKKFSKKHKAKIKYYETVAYQGNTILSNKKYNRELVAQLTGLKEEKLTEFIHFMDLDSEFIGRASEYEIAVKVMKEFENYLYKLSATDSTGKG